MLIKSTKLGDIEVSKERILCFEEGIPGFEKEKRFAMIEPEDSGAFLFLQAIDNVDLTFVGVDPFHHFSDYQVEIGDDTLKELKLSCDNQPFILCLVTVPEDYRKVTVNLLAPVLINLKECIAKQIILDNTAYTVRHRLFHDSPDNSGEGGK